MALASPPDHFAALFQLASLRFRQNRFADALLHFDRAAKVRPNESMVWSNLGIVLLALSRPADALASCDEALRLKPDHPEALAARGAALRALARPAEAAQSFERALALRPDDVGALVNYGCALQEMRLLDMSLAVFEKAIALRPDIAAIFANRAAVLIDLERPSEALASADRALALAPDQFQALGNRAAALALLKRPREALMSCDASLAANPDCAETWCNRAGVLAELNRPAEALESYDRALALNPADARSHENQAIVLGELGRFEEAGRAIRRAISLAPKGARLHYNLTQLERLSRTGPEAAAMQALAQDMQPLDVKERIFLHYALAKVHEDNGEMEAAFERQCAGAALKRGLVSYDEAAAIGAMERTREIFDAPLLQRLEGRGDASLAPVFIVGMMRSGSTLVEQILASHGGVAGLGEIDAFGKAMSPVIGPGAFPGGAAPLSQAVLRRIGASYISRVVPLAPAESRIIDKMLDNFRFLGLIHLALPNARFVHVHRDPVETCLSCFSKWFSDGVDWSYDLGELGRYYRSYEKLMAHWREVLPKGV